MEQDLPHTICGDFLLIATLLSIFELLRRSDVSGYFWSMADNKFQSRFCYSRLVANVAIRDRRR